MYSVFKGRMNAARESILVHDTGYIQKEKAIHITTHTLSPAHIYKEGLKSWPKHKVTQVHHGSPNP